MNPGSFSFGPVFWAVFLAIAAISVVATMCLFLWQASKEPAPRRQRAAAPARREALTTASEPKPVGRAA